MPANVILLLRIRLCDRRTEGWWETHWLLCKFRRHAQERGLPELIRMLEPLREPLRSSRSKLIVGADERDRGGRLGKRLASTPNPATVAGLQSRTGFRLRL